MKNRMKFLNKNDYEFFLKNKIKRKVQQFFPKGSYKPSSEDGDTRQLDLVNLLRITVRHREIIRDRPLWRMIYLSVMPGQGCSSVCQEAADLACENTAFDVLSIRNRPYEESLPEIILQLSCVRLLVGELRKHGLLRGVKYIISQSFLLFMLAVVLASLSGLIVNLLLPDTIPTNWVKIVWLVFAVAIFSTGGHVVVNVLTNSPVGKAGQELAGMISKYCDIAKEQDSEVYMSLIRLCAIRLLENPRVVIIDCISRLDRFSRDVIMTAIYDNCLTRDNALILIITDTGKFCRKLFQPHGTAGNGNFTSIGYYSVPNLGIEERLELCRAAGAELMIARSGSSLKDIVRPEESVIIEEHILETKKKERRDASGRFTITVRDVFSVGYDYYQETVRKTELIELCCSGFFGELCESLRIRRISKEEADAQTEKLCSNNPSLLVGNYLRLSLRNSEVLPDEVEGLIRLAWTAYWLNKVVGGNYCLSWFRLAAHHAEKVHWTAEIAMREKNRKMLRRFFEDARRAITECLNLALLEQAGKLSESLIRCWVVTRPSLLKVDVNTATLLEQILFRTVWQVMVLTQDRMVLLKSVNEYPDLDYDSLMQKDEFSNEETVWWRIYLILLGVDRKKAKVAKRVLFAEDTKLRVQEKWLIAAGMYFDYYLHLSHIGIITKTRLLKTADCFGYDLPCFTDFNHTKFWNTFIDDRSELKLVTRAAIMMLAIRVALESRFTKAALEGSWLLLEMCKEMEQSGDYCSVLPRAISMEAQTLSLEVLIASAETDSDSPFFPPAEPQDIAYRRKRIPEALLDDYIEIARNQTEEGEELSKKFAHSKDKPLPNSLYERVDRDYMRLVVLWQQLELSYRNAWSKISLIRFMIRESTASPQNERFVREYLSLLEEVNLQGAIFYAANSTAAIACKDYKDFSCVYIYRIALRAWEEGVFPNLAVSLLIEAVGIGGRLNIPVFQKLVRQIIRDINNSHIGTAVWNSVEVNERAIICDKFIHYFERLKWDEECYGLCCEAEKILQDKTLDPKAASDLEEALCYGRLTLEFASTKGQRLSDWFNKWEKQEFCQSHVLYLTGIWSRASVSEKSAMISQYVDIIDRIEETHLVDWLVTEIVRQVVSLDHFGDTSNMASLAYCAREIIEDRRHSFSLETQSDLAGFVLRVSDGQDETVGRILNDILEEKISRDFLEKILTYIRDKEPLAILFTYYCNLHWANVPKESSNQDLMWKLDNEVISDKEALSMFEKCPPLFINGPHGKAICRDFFKLAQLILLTEHGSTEFSYLRRVANEKAEKGMGDFFELAVSSALCFERLARLLDEHKKIILGIYKPGVIGPKMHM